MCSYEKAGWLGYRDLGFCDRDLGNRPGNLFLMNTLARIPGLSGTKHFQLRMVCKVADKSERGYRDLTCSTWRRRVKYKRVKFKAISLGYRDDKPVDRLFA